MEGTEKKKFGMHRSHPENPTAELIDCMKTKKQEGSQNIIPMKGVRVWFVLIKQDAKLASKFFSVKITA